MRPAIPILSALAFGVFFAGPAEAATCRNTGSFEKWLADFKKEALSQGISPSVLADASPYLQFEQRIVNRDSGNSLLQLDDFRRAHHRLEVIERIRILAIAQDSLLVGRRRIPDAQSQHEPVEL